MKKIFTISIFVLAFCLLPICSAFAANTFGVGLYDTKASIFYLKNSNTTGAADNTLGFGAANAGWVKLAGDWDGDGVTTIGLYNPATSTFYLKN